MRIIYKFEWFKNGSNTCEHSYIATFFDKDNFDERANKISKNGCKIEWNYCCVFHITNFPEYRNKECYLDLFPIKTIYNGN